MEISGPKVLALIMAGGAGSRLDVLTEDRAKPAMPFGGVYRLVDFPLSNCLHSGISDVWLIQQYEPHSLTDHLANGRPWDLDRTHGGLRVLHPYQGSGESGWHQGNADAIFKHVDFIREFDPDVIVVLSADHVYKLDYSKVIHEHVERRAELTIVTTRVPEGEASRFGIVEAGGDRVKRYSYKPERPASDEAAVEVFVFEASALLSALEDLARDSGSEGSEPRSLEDLGDSLLPRFVEGGHAVRFPLPGYWRDVGTIDSYWEGHMDLLKEEPPIDLDDPSWPILTLGGQRPPARILPPGRIENGLVSPGCVISGRIVRSVLGRGCVVEEGAIVRNSVLLDDVHVGPGAIVQAAIVDSQVRLGEGASVGSPMAAGEPGEHIAIVGARTEVPSGGRVPPGARIRPGQRSLSG